MPHYSCPTHLVSSLSPPLATLPYGNPRDSGSWRRAQNIDYLSATLNADIQHFTTFKDTGEVSPAKVIFASAVAILTLVRVRFLVQPLHLHPLIPDRTKTAW